MKKLITYFFILFSLVFLSQESFAQCGERYLNELFEIEQETTVYSDVYDREMDIYQPIEEGANLKRPVIILAHGGSFFAGSKENGTMRNLCRAFARRGYVTASINYYLTDNVVNLADSLKMVETVMRAISDGKAAIRFFRKDAATDNRYRIDPDQIFIGGNSAGAILALNLGVLGTIEEAPEFIQEIIARNGGIEGNSGNAGYSSEVQGIIGLAGGISRLSFLDISDPPIVSCHGDADGVVSFECDDVFEGDATFGFLDLVNLCGSGAFHPVATQVGISNSLKVYEGEGHTPWSFNNTMLEEVISFVGNFLYGIVVCEAPTSVANITNNAFNIRIQPNPAKANIQITSENHEIQQVQLFDYTGKLLQTINAQRQTNLKVERQQLPTGMYFAHIHLSNGKQVVEKVIFE